MAKYVAEIGGKDILRVELVGGKGRRLAELVKRRFPVPPFFCITTRAFRDFLAFNKISDHEPRRIRELIQSSPIPEPIRKEIERMYARWPHFPVAVRSSATCEDAPDVSWAGQFDSFLRVEGFDELLRAIRQCWSSAWKDNVIVYCKEQGIPQDQIDMAVVVQQMVSAEHSGVAFTADPVTGEERVIIEPEIGGQALSKGLSELAKSIDRHYDFPQDIEWAYYQGRFYILQSRPITTIQPTWTRGFFDERFPHAVSPLGWSILGELVKKRAFLDPLRYLGYKNAESVDIFRLIHGRPYVLVEVFQALYNAFPRFLLPFDWERYLPGPGYLNRRFYLLRRKSPIGRLVKLGISLVQDLNWILPLHYRNWRSFLRTCLRELKAIRQRDRRDASDGILKQDFQRLRAMVDEFLQIHRWSITWAEVLCGILSRITRQRKTLLDLIVSRSHSKTSEINCALWRLAHRGDPQEGLADFLEKYGHRANSLDISFPTWDEDPRFVLDLLKSYVGCPDPAQKGREALRRQKEVFELLGRRMSLLARILFSLILTWTQRMVLLREEQRFYWQMMMAEIRKVFLEFGRRLWSRDLIASPEDIFFLTANEFFRLIARQHIEVCDLIHKREEEKGRDEALLPPPFVTGTAPTGGRLSREGRVFQGMAISPGWVEGEASVVPDMRNYPQVTPGQILVTTGIDPGWTPILITLSALVLETGGALSHGAIVARELGLPAVANVRGATELIPAGARVIVNGDAGEVVILG